MADDAADREGSFRRNWETFADDIEARHAALRQELSLLDGWLARLADPVAGAVGAAFRAAFAATGCAENTSMDTGDAEAYFTAFSLKDDKSGFYFTNTITYGPSALAERGNLFATRCHESLHAIQYSRAAALYAVPYNDAPVLLCPRDFALLVQFAERDVFAKQTWLSSLGAKTHPDAAFTDIMQDAIPRFEELRSFPLTLDRVLAIMGRDIMACAVSDATGLPYNEQYARDALEKYEACLELREDDIRAGRCALVRLEPRDLWEVSGAFGPNLLGAAPPEGTLSPPITTADDRECVNRLNARLGIAAEDSLPTLREALAARGMLLEKLISASRGKKAPENTNGKIPLSAPYP